MQLEDLWMQNTKNGIFYSELSDTSEIHPPPDQEFLKSENKDETTGDAQHNTSQANWEAYEQEMKRKVAKNQERSEAFKNL